jgi:transposase
MSKSKRKSTLVRGYDGDITSLFSAALGLLGTPWQVSSSQLDADGERIDIQLDCGPTRLTCPHCGTADQPVHDRVEREWRHLDFFQFQAWLHARVPRVGCTHCGKTTQVEVPWAREGSGMTLLLEALALELCACMPVAEVARRLRMKDKQIWRRIEHYVTEARAKVDMSQVRIIGLDEISLKKGQDYITVVHELDPQAKRLLFATPGRDHKTVKEFAADLEVHGGKPTAIAHACADMSAAYTLGIELALPNALISYDRFHVVALAGEAMDEVRSAEWKQEAALIEQELGHLTPAERRSILWGMRRNPNTWNQTQIEAMHWLQRTNLKSARAWRLKMGLREVFAHARSHNDAKQAAKDLKDWISWARHCRLEPFKRLGATLKKHFDAVVRGMLDNRSNAYVEAMNGVLQQIKRAARGFRTAANFIAIAFLRMGKLAHLPASPFRPASPRMATPTIHRA